MIIAVCTHCPWIRCVITVNAWLHMKGRITTRSGLRGECHRHGWKYVSAITPRVNVGLLMMSGIYDCCHHYQSENRPSLASLRSFWFTFRYWIRTDSHIPCRFPAMTLPLSCHSPFCLTRAGRPHAVSGRPMLVQTYHAVPMPFPCRSPAANLPRPREVAFRTAYSWHGRGTAWHVWIKQGRTV
jgi:hypothetical protein